MERAARRIAQPPAATTSIRRQSAQALGDTFLLSADFVDQLRFRLAGTRVCALFCRELKGEILAALWGDNSRKTIDDILAIVTGESEGVVTGLTGRAEDGAEIDLEMLLLPLVRSRPDAAPACSAYWRR